ncbi:peptidoglycan-binding domain-containing protein [Novosphingobium sp. PASSN1]|uniref:peptidoglycan-binding domain-containing protein n=1 Tax=Novosphingobium sp. PASSN1 TaxID=2015561 RepID=UPI0025F5E4D7|nr:peptidoglycan-binding domain-containing protein [Novosphingobium sp. PASSN1]
MPLPGLIAAVLVAVAGVPAQARTSPQAAATSPALGEAISVLPPEETIPPVDATPPADKAEASGGLPQAAAAPPAATALPAGAGVLDSATVQRIVDRLVSLNFLANAVEAQDPDRLTAAIRDFQSSAGISPSGTFDRDTVGRLTTP